MKIEIETEDLEKILRGEYKALHDLVSWANYQKPANPTIKFYAASIGAKFVGQLEWDDTLKEAERLATAYKIFCQLNNLPQNLLLNGVAWDADYFYQKGLSHD